MANKNFLQGIPGILFMALILGCPAEPEKNNYYSPYSPYSPPSALESPTGLSGVVKSSSGVELAWNPVDGAESYAIRYQKTSDSPSNVFLKISSRTTTLEAANLEAHTSYNFQVAACTDIDGLDDGAYSSPITLTTNPYAAPSAPTGLAADAVYGSSDKITLTWSQVETTEKYSIVYKVYYKKYNASDAGSNGLALAARTYDASYEFSRLEALTEYVFYVKSTGTKGYDDIIDSVYSIPAIAKTNVAKPTNARAVVTTYPSRNVDIYWDYVQSAAWYYVYMLEHIGSGFTDNRGIESATLVKKVTENKAAITYGLNGSKWYSFFIRAANADGAGTAEYVFKWVGGGGDM